MTAAIDALDEVVAAESVDFEGLCVERDDDGYRLDAPDGTARGLAAAELRAALEEHRDHVREWYYWTQVVPRAPEAVAFLRWLEGADDRDPATRRAALDGGRTREWGQLLLSVSPVEGGRRTYEVRHVADADARVEDLTVSTDPGAMCDRRRTDADGDYRPLSTAPDLPPGWAFVDLGPGELVETVEHCYPATVANWYRERTGDLDVVHWRATAARQTGIYDVVDEVAGDAVDDLAQACCVDSQCLKRREWDEHDGSEQREGSDGREGKDGREGNDGSLDAPRGEGEFPCREPCSLVVAAAREAALTEREPAETRGLDLRPREVAQVRRVLDAVAEGDLTGTERGDVPDGANQLRVRYLRERLRDRGSPLASEGVADPGDAGDAGESGDDGEAVEAGHDGDADQGGDSREGSG